MKSTNFTAWKTLPGGSSFVVLCIAAAEFQVPIYSVVCICPILRAAKVRTPFLSCCAPPVRVDYFPPGDVDRAEKTIYCCELEYSSIQDMSTCRAKLPCLPAYQPAAFYVSLAVQQRLKIFSLAFFLAGYGCVIEAPPVHPGLMGLVLPWNDALSHRCCFAVYQRVRV